MTIDRQKFNLPFSKYNVPLWACPKCGAGLLELQPETLNFKETATSLEGHDYEGWDPEWITYRFACMFVCNNRNCREASTATGTGYLSEEPDMRLQEINYVKNFKPEYFSPSPVIFPIPGDVPEDIADQISASFAAFWGDAATAGNKIRQAIELLMDFKRVPKTEVRRGVRTRRSLHSRIKEFKNNQPEVGEQLLAIKWLGNAGSHPGGLSKDDVMDAYEILQHVLDELFVKRRARVRKLTKAIIHRRGAVKS